jgi:hypothetical protein
MEDERDRGDLLKIIIKAGFVRFSYFTLFRPPGLILLGEMPQSLVKELIEKSLQLSSPALSQMLA